MPAEYAGRLAKKGSRCSGRYASVFSNSSGPVSTLKNSAAPYLSGAASYAHLLLLRLNTGITMLQGWPRGWWLDVW